MADTQAYDSNTCVVCFKNVLYYSIGECDHPVCFECSTRMRVLCLQNECPICRQDLARVVFTDSIQPYKELRNKAFVDRLFERQYKIGFCSADIKKAYDQLLEYRCRICTEMAPFRNFSMLNDHVRKVHEKYFCDLCVKHLKIFTSERKCYTRQELAHHRRKGDLDDTSHRGHPLCEFCEERFMDADELYRHLRKEHLYCHLCDADGKNLYYASHPALAQHFRKDHYLCEEGECAGQHLTAVFRSEIDLKAHKATIHGRGMPRGAARQARTLELQFNITPHPAGQRTPRDREQPRAPSPPPAPPSPRIDTRSDQQFPRLSSAPQTQNLMLTGAHKSYNVGNSLARTEKNFPALDGSGVNGQGGSRSAATPATSNTRPAPVAATLVRNSKPSVSIQLHSQPASASNFRLTQTSGNRISIPPQQKKQPISDEDFPSLSVPKDDHPNLGVGTVQPPKVTLINSQEMQALKTNHQNTHAKKPQLSSEAFPALASTSVPTAPPQWITVSKSKEKSKPNKKETVPQPKEPAFNPVADFPTLPVNSKPKSKKVAQILPISRPQPTPQSQPPQQNDTKTKKEKKNQNNVKKENYPDSSLLNGVVDNNRKMAREMSYEMGLSNKIEVDRKIKTVDTAVSVEKKNGGNGDFALAAKDYPPLNAKNENFVPPKCEFNAPSKKVPNGNVPPGFKKRPPCDGMTFTNSSGQTFPAPVHTYIPPPDFEHRNRALVKKFVTALGSTAALEDFKVASRAFRDNIISADEFYEHCKTAMGSHLEDVFPDLVALLPDIAKQQELVVGRDISPNLKVCSVCGQLVSPSDQIAHDTAHWPPLAPR